MKSNLIVLCLGMFSAVFCLAQDTDRQLPFRLEMGGYGSHVDNGYGNWTGAQTSLWIRKNPIFIPMVYAVTETRPAGTQQNYGFFSYLNWSKSFYTTQGFSMAPQSSASRIYFPKRRYDIRANWKLPSMRNLVVGAGYTRFDMGAPGHGQFFNVGAIWYHKKLVVTGDAFLNRNQPGNLYSGSGRVSAQYGREGKSWVGVAAGGGRELYQYLGQTPLNVQFNGYTLQAFYRKWLTRHVGVVGTMDYQDRLGAYRRIGGAASLFFEF